MRLEARDLGAGRALRDPVLTWSQESGAESSYWDKWASESQVESSPGLGSQGSGRLGPSRHGRARGPGAPQQSRYRRVWAQDAQP